jgi:hypothetical protein
MTRNYKSLLKETHESTLLLQKAYDRGYAQAEADYKKPEIGWIPTPCKGGIQFRCDGCRKFAIAAYEYCPNCGCGRKKEDGV